MNPAPLPVVPPRMEALLHALSVERGRCRRATVSLQNAHETILTLEAQVARREAELESGDHRRIADVRPIPRKHGLFESLHPNLPDVPPSETVYSLAIAEEHNCVLEREVSLLNARVSHLSLLNCFSHSVTGVSVAGGWVFPRVYLSCDPDFTSGI